MGESHPLLDAQSERVTTCQVLTAPTFSASPSERLPCPRLLSCLHLWPCVSPPGLSYQAAVKVIGVLTWPVSQDGRMGGGGEGQVKHSGEGLV